MVNEMQMGRTLMKRRCNVGRRLKIETGLCRAVVLCAGLGFVLAGCAGQKSETGNRKPEGNKVEIPNPENFTTLGKPTKTIQTPNGPVEIYDPTRDPEVRAAFRVIYDKNNLIVSTYGGPWDQNGKPVYGAEGTTLKKARKAMAYSLLQGNVCAGVIVANCSTSYSSICKQGTGITDWDKCEKKVISQTISMPRRVIPMYQKYPIYSAVPKARDGMVMCTFDKTKIISTDDKIIGPISPESFNRQLEWFFSYSCRN